MIALLLAIAIALPPQDALREATQRVGSVPAEERARAIEELVALCDAAAAELAGEHPGDGPVEDAAGRDAHRALAQALSTAASKGVELDVDRRVALHLRSRDAAARGGQTEPQARAGLLAAHLLLEVGRAREGLDAIETTRARAPKAEKTLPFLLRARVEAERQLGELAKALATLDECERATPEGDAWAPLAWRVAGARGSVWLELGLPDLAAASFEREKELLAAASGADADDRLAAKLHELSLALARGDHRGVAERSAEFVARDPLFARSPRWRAAARAAGARAAAQIARTEPAEAARARERLAEAIDDAAQHARERAALEIRLAELELRASGTDAAHAALERARTLLDAFPSAPERTELDTIDARAALVAHAPRERLAALRERLRAHVEEQARTWAALPRRGGGHGWLLPGARRALLVELLAIEDALDGPRAALEAWLAIETPTALARSANATRADVEALAREYLAPGEGVLVWCSGPERGLVVSFAADGARVEPIGAEHAVRAACDRWSARADDDDRDDVARGALASLLPPETLARLAGWSAVTLVALDQLGDPAFERLPHPRGGRFGETVAVAALPSLAFGLDAAREASTPGAYERDVVLVAATRPDPALRGELGALEDLDVGADELRAIVAHRPTERTTTLAGADATRERFLALPLASARVLHWLGHGASDDARERPAVLVLAASEHVGALVACEDVEALRAPPLVVLLACRAASGPLREGEGGPAGMAAAWLAAGARCVVASALDLPLELALDVSRAFEAAIARDVPPAEALRAVRAELGKDERSRAALAGLRAYGLGQRVPSTSSAPSSTLAEPGAGFAASRTLGKLVLVVATALAALVAIVRIFRRRRAQPDGFGSGTLSSSAGSVSSSSNSGTSPSGTMPVSRRDESP